MKKLIFKSTILALLFTITFSNTSNAQSKSGSDKSAFEMSFKDPNEGSKFKAKVSSVVINHEEQYSFAEFEKAAQKSKSLTFAAKKLPTNSFKAGYSLGQLVFAKNDKSLKLKDVKVLKNQQKGKERQIQISYKGVK